MKQCTPLDVYAVSLVLDHNTVYIPINGQSCENPGQAALSALTMPGVIVLMPNDGTVFIFVSYNQDIFHVHFAALPGYRGKMVIDAMKEAFLWIWKNTHCKKLVGYELVSNRRAIKFIGCLGVNREGLLKNADGHGGDMAVFGLCRP